MSTSECYSESEHDDPEITDTPPPPYRVQTPPPPSVSAPVITFLLQAGWNKTLLKWWTSRNNLKHCLEMSTLCFCKTFRHRLPAQWQSTQLAHPAPQGPVKDQFLPIYLAGERKVLFYLIHKQYLFFTRFLTHCYKLFFHTIPSFLENPSWNLFLFITLVAYPTASYLFIWVSCF